MSTKFQTIFVDLDGTLVRTDLFLEALVKIVSRNPFRLIEIIRWALNSRPFAKERAADQVKIDAAQLCYETPLLDYLRQKKHEGKRIVLATAAHRSYAAQVAAHLGIFDSVIATEAGSNLKGSKKLAAILVDGV